MRFQDILRFVWLNLWRSKIRTLLTTIGVIIGTVAIVIMISIGSSAKKNIANQIMALDSVNEITIMPQIDLESGPSLYNVSVVKPLNDQAFREIDKIRGIQATTPILTIMSSEIKLGLKSANITVQGIDPQYANMKFNVESGRNLRKGDRNSVILGSKIGSLLKNTQESKNKGVKNNDNLKFNKNGLTSELVHNEELLYKKVILKLNRVGSEQQEKIIKLTVIGILQETGREDDTQLILPLETVKEIKAWQGNTKKNIDYDVGKAIVNSPDKIHAIQNDIEKLGYTTTTMKELLGSINALFSFVEVTLGGIGSIALFVAAFGIINTMIMAIYERTKEIGILKVLGATLNDIKLLFLVEASMIGFFGGVFGILISFGTTSILNFIIDIFFSNSTTDSFKFISIPLWLVVFGLSFSTMIGLLAGIYPATRAAHLSPLEAMRHN